MHLRSTPLRHFCTAIPIPPGHRTLHLVLPPASKLHTRHRTFPKTPNRHAPFSTTARLPTPSKPPKRSIEHASALASAAAHDPYDLSALDADIARALADLTSSLSHLRPGGRFNPAALEVLRVTLAKGSKETVRLRDVAQVLPRGGRSVTVVVGEAEVRTTPSAPLPPLPYPSFELTVAAQHTKAVVSAIRASPYSLNPVPAPHSPLELNIPVPPPTQEARLATLALAARAGEGAAMAVRQARGAQQKVLRAMELARTVRPDDLKRARERMEKVVEGGNEEVKRRVEEARRGLSA
ncbi:hypothetical protein MMC13_006229 [Lambiella insularis]|nr:hypothetical protein [Lambiella insularis]